MTSSCLGGFSGWALLAIVFGQAIAWPQAERTEIERRLEIEKRDSPIIDKIVCSWQGAQAALVRDTIYLYGGYLLSQTVNTNGQAAQPVFSISADLFSLNLTQPFNTKSGNLTNIIIDESMAIGQSSSPWSTGGHMLANDYEFILYGGEIDASNQTGTSGVLPSGNTVTSRELYPHDPVPLSQASWFTISLGKDISWYVTGGGYANVPSENTAYVFSGSRSESWGEIEANTLTQSVLADTLSDQLIAVDMTTMKGETWTNKTAPSSIPARAHGELVWIPAGGKGTLVALGGTALNQSGIDAEIWTPTEEEQAKFLKQGQGFMENITLYDIEGDKWYMQQTTGAIPNATAEFCAVVATSQDGSSHQIYVYGGAPDITPLTLGAEIFSDDVYILSIPSFIWTKGYGGQSNAARKGHRCQKVSDNQFMVVGGIPTSISGCFDASFVRVFDMNELQFVDNYDPSAAADYQVPGAVTKGIGGTATGGATATPGKWSSNDLSTLLSAKYDGTIKNWWPYKSVNTTSTGADSTASSSSPSASSTSSSSGSSLPSYVPPLLGAILGLLVVIAILCLVLFILRRRRHKMKKLQSDSAASTTAGGARNRRTWSWLVGTHDPEKPPIDSEYDHTPQTDKTEWLESHGTTVVDEFSPKAEKPNPMHELSNDRIYEMPGTAMSEMPGDAAAQEMHGDIAAQEVQGDAGATELPTHRTTKVNFAKGAKY